MRRLQPVILSEAKDLARLRTDRTERLRSLAPLGMRCLLALIVFNACKKATPPVSYQALPGRATRHRGIRSGLGHRSSPTPPWK